MRQLLAILLSVAWFGPAMAEEPKAPDKPPAKQRKCDRPCCGCDFGLDRKLVENDELYKRCHTCWGDLAQFECNNLSDQAYAAAMDKIYVEARKNSKIVLYYANTGG